MSEQCHQRLQAHAGIGEFGGPGMTQLVRSDDEDGSVGAAQPSVLGGGDQAVAQPSQPETVAAGDEQEIGELPGPRVWQRPAGSAGSGPLVEHGEALSR